MATDLFRSLNDSVSLISASDGKDADGVARRRLELNVDGGQVVLRDLVEILSITSAMNKWLTQEVAKRKEAGDDDAQMISLVWEMARETTVHQNQMEAAMQRAQSDGPTAEQHEELKKVFGAIGRTKKEQN